MEEEFSSKFTMNIINTIRCSQTVASSEKEFLLNRLQQLLNQERVQVEDCPGCGVFYVDGYTNAIQPDLEYL